MIFAGLLYLGLFALAASMSRHAQLVPAQWRAATPGNRLQGAGWLLVLASLAVALWSADWPMRLLAWIGLVPATGGIVALGLTYDIRWARTAASLALLLVFAGLVARG
jgi:hypothetical protein